MLPVVRYCRFMIFVCEVSLYPLFIVDLTDLDCQSLLIVVYRVSVRRLLFASVDRRSLYCNYIADRRVLVVRCFLESRLTF
jgi:hypothetical protein